MPSSIQVAFEKALSKTQTHVAQPIPAEWDDETTETKIEEINTVQTQTAEAPKRVYFQTTNNVTRVTFNFVRDNPGLTRLRIAELLEMQNYKRTSTTSLIGQMVKQGLVRDSNGALFVTQPEYTPLKSRLTRPAKPVVQEVVAKPTRMAQVEPKAPRAASTNTLLAEEFDADKFVGVMTLKQAKAVYDALRKIFG